MLTEAFLIEAPTVWAGILFIASMVVALAVVVPGRWGRLHVTGHHPERGTLEGEAGVAL